MQRYSRNECKVYKNAGLRIVQESKVTILQQEYDELAALVDMFSYKANAQRLAELHEYLQKVLPTIYMGDYPILSFTMQSYEKSKNEWNYYNYQNSD